MHWNHDLTIVGSSHTGNEVSWSLIDRPMGAPPTPSIIIAATTTKCHVWLVHDHNESIINSQVKKSLTNSEVFWRDQMLGDKIGFLFVVLIGFSCVVVLKYVCIFTLPLLLMDSKYLIHAYENLFMKWNITSDADICRRYYLCKRNLK